MKLLLPILEVFGLFVCLNRFWPKGVIHGEHEDWEKEYRSKNRGFGSSKTSASKGRRESGASGNSRSQVRSEGRASEREVYGRGGPMYDHRLSTCGMKGEREDKRYNRNEDDEYVYSGREKRGSVASRGYGNGR